MPATINHRCETNALNRRATSNVPFSTTEWEGRALHTIGSRTSPGKGGYWC